jgi:hypothetical protein
MDGATCNGITPGSTIIGLQDRLKALTERTSLSGRLRVISIEGHDCKLSLDLHGLYDLRISSKKIYSNQTARDLIVQAYSLQNAILPKIFFVIEEINFSRTLVSGRVLYEGVEVYDISPFDGTLQISTRRLLGNGIVNNLTSLNFSQTELSVEGFAQILKTNKVQTLFVDYCGKINSLENVTCSSLRHLSIVGTGIQVNRLLIKKIEQLFPNLTFFDATQDLGKCFGIKDGEEDIHKPIVLEPCGHIRSFDSCFKNNHPVSNCELCNRTIVLLANINFPITRCKKLEEGKWSLSILDAARRALSGDGNKYLHKRCNNVFIAATLRDLVELPEETDETKLVTEAKKKLCPGCDGYSLLELIKIHGTFVDQVLV